MVNIIDVKHEHVNIDYFAVVSNLKMKTELILIPYF